MAGNSARITASASNSLNAESVSRTGTGRPTAANCSSALLAVCCWRRRSPRQAAIEADPQFGQVLTEDFCLADTGGRQDVIVVCTKGGLAMSNQIDTAHVRVIPVR